MLRTAGNDEDQAETTSWVVPIAELRIALRFTSSGRHSIFWMHERTNLSRSCSELVVADWQWTFGYHFHLKNLIDSELAFQGVELR